MKRINDVKADINTKATRQRGIVDSAENEKRNMKPKEIQEWNQLDTEIRELEGELKILEAQEVRNRASAVPVSSPNSGASISISDDDVEDRSFQIMARPKDEARAPLSSWVLRNMDVSEASRKADPFAVIAALGSGRPKNAITERALGEVRSVSGGTNLVDSYLSAKVLEVMLEKSHLANVGMKILPMQSSTHGFGRISEYPAFSWLAAGATQSEQSVTFDSVSLSAKTLRSWARVTREFLQDAVNAEQVLRTAFQKSGSNEIDRVGLEGTGTGQEPRGVASLTGVSSFSMGTDGAAQTDYDHFIDITTEILEANGSIPNTAIMAPSRWADLQKLKEATTDAPLARPAALQNWSFRETAKILTNRTQGASSLASNIYVGNFDLLTLGVLLNMEIGFVNHDAATNSMDILAVFRGDFASEYAPGLGKIIGVL